MHVAVGNKESEAFWTKFFRHMLQRGLRLPTTVTSDGAPGLVKSIKVCFPASIRIRCWFHRLANIRAKLPDETAGEVMAHVYAARDAPTLDASALLVDGGHAAGLGGRAAVRHDATRPVFCGCDAVLGLWTHRLLGSSAAVAACSLARFLCCLTHLIVRVHGRHPGSSVIDTG